MAKQSGALLTAHLQAADLDPEPRRRDPDRRGGTDPAHDGAAQVHRGQHPFDYCNTANYWLRTSDNPYQPRILYLMASFVNDAARANKLYSPVLEQEFAGFDLSGRTPEALLRDQDEAIMSFDVPRATAIAQCLSAIGRGPHAASGRRLRSPPASSRTIRTTRRSAIRRSRSTGTTRPTCATGCCWRLSRLLAGWPKMPGERDCYARFMREWINN